MSLWILKDPFSSWRKRARGAEFEPCIPGSVWVQIPLKHGGHISVCQRTEPKTWENLKVSTQRFKFSLVSTPTSSPISWHEQFY